MELEVTDVELLLQFVSLVAQYFKIHSESAVFGEQSETDFEVLGSHAMRLTQC